MSDEKSDGGVGCWLGVLVLGIVAWVGVDRASAWWHSRSDPACLYAVSFGASEMCVTDHVIQDADLTFKTWSERETKRPSLFCGDPMRAADFASKSGRKICAYSTVRFPTVVAPPSGP